MADRSELERAVQTIYGARNENDLDTIMAWFDPACRFRIVGSTWLGLMTQPVNGTDSIRSSIQALLENWDLSGVSTVSLHVDGDTVCVHRAGPVRFIPSNTSKEMELMDKFTFKDGRVVDFAEFVDTLEVAETVGLLSR
ncbi:nuclear transport factor 2 family protein [Ensifer sp. BR816]|uniref:nuclear transport factor 2 family protein n=1 Tax=Rhizobium sp. (strain BR816) TaxID=1057002 RepID=UPI00036C54C4|nr:nuclear transport factor 2 family protein [Ensifer sp. BR816]